MLDTIQSSLFNQERWSTLNKIVKNAQAIQHLYRSQLDVHRNELIVRHIQCMKFLTPVV